MHHVNRIKASRRGIVHQKCLTSTAIPLSVAQAYDFGEYFQRIKIFETGGVDELDIHRLCHFTLQLQEKRARSNAYGIIEDQTTRPSCGLRATRYPHPQQGTVQQNHAGEAFTATFFSGQFTGVHIMQISRIWKKKFHLHRLGEAVYRLLKELHAR